VRHRTPVLIAAALAVCTIPVAIGAASQTPPPVSGTTTATATTSSIARFFVKGDWGTGSIAQAAITKRMCARDAVRPVDFILTTGDNFYSPDGRATQATFDRPEACLIRSGLRWRATWGNHDLGGDSTATRLASPRHWYTFTDGPARIIVLDANQPSSAAQLAFLTRTLVAATEPVRIVSMHQPVYTAGLHAPGEVQQRLWAPLFQKYGVSLVLQGHNHAYERMVVGGVTYITTGGGGAPLYPCVRPAPGLVRCLSVHHFLEVAADPTGIDVRAVRSSGTTLESVRVPVRARALSGQRHVRRS